MRWGVAVLAVLALGACSGDDSTTEPTTPGTTGPAATTRVTPPATPAPPTTSAPSVTSSAPTATAVPSTTEPVTSLTTVAAATDEWCLRAAELNQLAGAFRQLDATDRDGVEQALAEILDRLERIEAVVPAQLAADLTVSADVDYDMATADFTQLDERRPAIVAANSRIRVYNHDECGLDAGVTGAEVP
jgi:hypothetical protein